MAYYGTLMWVWVFIGALNLVTCLMALYGGMWEWYHTAALLVLIVSPFMVWLLYGWAREYKARPGNHPGL